MVSLSQVTVAFGGFDLFKDISFLINQRDRIGLVGRNGAGKTTLLKMIAGHQPIDSGIISKPSSLTIGYLPQEMKYTNKGSLIDEVRTAFAEVLVIEKEIKKIEISLETRTDYESKEYLELIDNLSHLTDRFHHLEAGGIESKIEKTLLGLGFLKTDFNRLTSEFSGGWRMRIELAKILLQNPELLLLDEPTNHLDIESIQWLEDFLKDYYGAVLLISHDRAFLDNVTNRTIEISLGRIYDYKVSYTKFVELRKERREQQMAAYVNQQKMIGDTEQFIERFRSKATKAIQVQSRIKQLNKIERLEVDDEDNADMHFRFPPAPHSGAVTLELEGLTKNYGSLNVLNNIDLLIERGSKIAFVGKNGERKTTLSRIILNEIEYDGICKHGHNVKVGYFAQNQDELLDGDRTVFETIDQIAVGEIRPKIRSILGSFLFSGEDVDKKVKVLSGGEKSRLALAKLLLTPVNLLVLDEPTNHLDMRSKDILKQALIKFDGTLIIVSHDRDFLNGLVNIVYEFKDHKMKQYLGGIYDFLEKKKLATLKELEKKISVAQVTKVIETTNNKEQYFEKKEQEKVVRKVKTQLTACEKKIDEIEKLIASQDFVLANPSKFNVKIDDEFYAKYTEYKNQLNDQMELWEKLQLEIEELEKLN